MIFNINFSAAGEINLPDGSEIGFVGEHNAVTLAITVPNALIDGADYHCVAVQSGLSVYRSEPIYSGASGAAYRSGNVIYLTLWRQVLMLPEISVQVEAYSLDALNEPIKIAKSPLCTGLQLKPSVCGEEEPVSGEPGLAASLLAQLHENFNVLSALSSDGGELTFDGRSVGDDNVIEEVRVNGTVVEVDADKAVDITVPTQASDIGAAAASHNHLGTYSPLAHNHNAVYASATHNHDGDYSPSSHSHNGVYSPSSHNHNGVYSPSSHNHGEEYSALNHDHDEAYAPASTLGQIISNNFLQLPDASNGARAYVLNASDVGAVFSLSIGDTLTSLCVREFLSLPEAPFTMEYISLSNGELYLSPGDEDIGIPYIYYLTTGGEVFYYLGESFGNIPAGWSNGFTSIAWSSLPRFENTTVRSVSLSSQSLLLPLLETASAAKPSGEYIRVDGEWVCSPGQIIAETFADLPAGMPEGTRAQALEDTLLGAAQEVTGLEAGDEFACLKLDVPAVNPHTTLTDGTAFAYFYQDSRGEDEAVALQYNTSSSYEYPILILSFPADDLAYVYNWTSGNEDFAVGWNKCVNYSSVPVDAAELPVFTNVRFITVGNDASHYLKFFLKAYDGMDFAGEYKLQSGQWERVNAHDVLAAPVIHNHDSSYAEIDHTHSEYAPYSHDHDSRYNERYTTKQRLWEWGAASGQSLSLYCDRFGSISDDVIFMLPPGGSPTVPLSITFYAEIALTAGGDVPSVSFDSGSNAVYAGGAMPTLSVGNYIFTCRWHPMAQKWVVETLAV